MTTLFSLSPTRSVQARDEAMRNFASRRTLLATVSLVLCGLLNGCAALTNPVADGIPVRRLPPELLGKPRNDERVIPLTLLRQKPPDVYRLDAGDVLGVWIEGVLGERNQTPPVRLDTQANVPPSLGYPIPVREDGTLPLPLVAPVQVRGLSIAEAQEKIREAYLRPKAILREGSERIIVTLMQPRRYHVMVVRQDSGGLTIAQSGLISSTKRGTGASIQLPAYENDVLNALTLTGGLPGLDAMNEVIIQRGSFRSGEEAANYLAALQQHGELAFPQEGSDGGGQIIRIPLRARPGELPPFRPEDVILRNGDIVFIDSRDTELFYTGGLLFARQFVLPRDYDLRMTDAIGLANGPLINGNLNFNNIFGANLAAAGIGFPSPSQLSVIRRLPGNRQIVIKVDLNRALRDPRENILVMPGDTLILQETVGEALARYFTAVFRLNWFGTIIRERDLTTTATLNIP